MPEKPRKRAAIGLRAHSGWAALVVVAGSATEPEVVLREEIELADPKINGSKQPYHEAEGLRVADARPLLSRMEAGSLRLATAALEKALERSRASGHRVVGCALLLASGRPLPDLASTLASHALIHTADGDHFRSALAGAAASFDLPVTGVREKEIYAEASRVLKRTEAELKERMAKLGKELGPPWTADQKLPTLAGWIALASS